MEFQAAPSANILPLNRVPSLRAQLLRQLYRKQWPTYIWCTLFTALGGFLWGYDTGSIGPITVMPQFEARFGILSPTVQGILVCSILIAAAITSAFAGPLSDRFSRTYMIVVGSTVFAAGCAIASSAMHLPQLFIGRCITGVGEGLFISSITVYVTEISPAHARGRLGTCMQLFSTLGTMLGYFTCYGTVKQAGSFSWRFPFASQACVAVVLAVGTAFFPHSPRWLHHVGRHEEAERARRRLGMQVEEAKKDETNDSATPIPSHRPFWDQAKDLWAKDVRGRTTFCLFIMGIQQLSGIDAVLYYAPTLFSRAGLPSSQASFLASGVSGILMVVLTSGSQWFQDRWSRRTQMIGGGLVIGGAMLLIGILYATHADETFAGGRAIIVLIYVFVAGYVTSWAIVARIVCNEVPPSKMRAPVAALGQCVNWGVNCIVAFMTPVFLSRTSSGPYFLFGACSLLGVAACIIFQPETKGLPLEVIDEGLLETPFQSALKKRFGLRNRATRSGPPENHSGEISEPIQMENMPAAVTEITD